MIYVLVPANADDNSDSIKLDQRAAADKFVFQNKCFD